MDEVNNVEEGFGGERSVGVWEIVMFERSE